MRKYTYKNRRNIGRMYRYILQFSYNFLFLFHINNWSGDFLVNGTNVSDNSFVPAVYVWCRKWSDSRVRRHPLAAVSASSVGSLANHSLCNCEAVLRQYGGGRLLAQSITMRRVYWPDNQQTRLLLPRLRRPSKWELRSASLRMILRSGSVTFPRASPPVGDPTTSISATSLSRKCLYSADTAAKAIGVKWYTWSKSCGDL